MKIEDIFSRALQIRNQADRKAYLDQACAKDSGLREQVESLLAAHEEAASFLENPVTELSPQTTPPQEGSESNSLNPSTAHRPITEGPGTIIGRYKLLQQIGEGGMGVVYMAEQEQPVRRRVALKIIKPGMDSAQVIARFEAERQALAMMDHPNIARVLDAGTTDTGRPYFVMELVQGIPITQYCDDKQLDTHARLELFVQVCNAIQHAHQKGIIHRDLKPSNVLVAIYDAKPVPKIIDFGVAKALHQRLTEKTMFTQFGAVVGTLEYMSPEQADMDLMGTDTRSDIYSLGVLLYELLTGSTPLDGKKLRSLGYAEMLKTIREVDPPKPSTRLSQSINEVASISARRQTEPRRLQKLVAGDLDWIVMKCLEKDRARRYETANGLAMDIQRHLSDEAVSASPPGQFYKLQKLVRRNKFACAAVASVMLALLLGLAGSLWQAARAHHEAMRAQNETALAQREAERANKALKDLQAAAPSIAIDADALAAKGQFDQAIEKLNYAATLQPDVPEFRVGEGDLYLCQLKISQAAVSYRDALRLNPGITAAKSKANLCDQLLAAPTSTQGKLSLESLSKINSALVADKLPDAELKHVKDAYADEKERLWKYWMPRLQSLPMFAKLPPGSPEWAQRFDVRDDGQLTLYLGQMDVGDLSQLKGLPVADLFLSNSKNVTDVLPLADIPSLENLTVPMFVKNVDALRRLPNLKRLSYSVSQPQNADALNNMIQVLISQQQNQGSDNSSALNAIKRVMVLSIKGPSDVPTPDTTPEQFWQETPWLWLFHNAGIKFNRLAPRDADGYPGTWDLDLNNTGISDLSILKGLPLSGLGLNDDPVVDLSPLRGMPLARLDIVNTPVTDLSPLKGMHLDAFHMDGTPVADLSPLQGIINLSVLGLKDCKNITDLSPLMEVKGLRWLILPPHVKNIQILHGLPKLETIEFVNDRLPPADFFKKYDPGEWELTLRKAGIEPRQISRQADGTWSISFDNNKDFSDLSILQGMPISILGLQGTSVTDLTPLRGMPLTDLQFQSDKVADLTPLKGMHLTVLFATNSKITDLRPLQGMPLEYLSLDGTPVSDLSPLRGMPLTMLRLRNCANLTNLSPLTDLKQLTALTLPPNFTDFEFLHTLPKLQRLSFDGIVGPDYGPDKTTDQFWAALTTEMPWAAPLHKANIPYKLRRVTSDHAWELTLDNQPISDLSMLKGGNISQLSLVRTPVSDLSPLVGMKLTALGISNTKVADLWPIKAMALQKLSMSTTLVSDLKPLIGMPLRQLYMANCKQITDVSALAGMGDTLETLTLPPNAKDIEFLRKFPKLQRISFKYDTAAKAPAQSATEFWADYDHQKATASTLPSGQTPAQADSHP